MALPSPPNAGNNRPAYLDNLFREGSHSLNKTPSLRSAHSSISSSASSSDIRALHAGTRPLSPAYEEEDHDDRSSIRSLKLQFSPRRSFRNLLNRRTYPQVKEMVDVEFPPAPTSSSAAPKHSRSANGSISSDRRPSTRGGSRRPSLPKLQTSSSAPKLSAQAQMYASKPLPAAPSAKAEELRCQPCYYFAARNCNGYVFGGAHGDACENCLVSLPPAVAAGVLKLTVICWLGGWVLRRVVVSLFHFLSLLVLLRGVSS